MRKEKTLKVQIPKGIDSGRRIRLTGEGEAGVRGGPSGDLYVLVAIKPHRLFRRDGASIGGVYNDCGTMIFDPQRQDVHAGGSGCGCGASVLGGYLLTQMEAGKLRRLLFCATGALMSPISTWQGESIPAVCHAVSIQMERR